MQEFLSLTLPLWSIFWIGALHFFADFVCQSDKMARGKSSSNYWLTYHVNIYASIMLVGVCPLFAFFHPWNAGFWLLWGILNGILHWCTDYVTSRWSKKYFSVQDYHNGFVVVGFDQLIHLVTLLGTLAWMVK